MAVLSIGCTDSAPAGSTAPGDLEWPKQVTLFSADFAQNSESLRLADGKLVDDAGDISLFLGVQLSLQHPVNDSEFLFCLLGTFASLADLPADVRECSETAPDGWRTHLFLSAASPHSNEESTVIGLSALVRSPAGDAVYRLRVQSDSVSLNDAGSLGTATVTFEYEPIGGLPYPAPADSSAPR